MKRESIDIYSYPISGDAMFEVPHHLKKEKQVDSHPHTVGKEEKEEDKMDLDSVSSSEKY